MENINNGIAYTVGGHMYGVMGGDKIMAEFEKDLPKQEKGVKMISFDTFMIDFLSRGLKPEYKKLTGFKIVIDDNHKLHVTASIKNITYEETYPLESVLMSSGEVKTPNNFISPDVFGKKFAEYVKSELEKQFLS